MNPVATWVSTNLSKQAKTLQHLASMTTPYILSASSNERRAASGERGDGATGCCRATGLRLEPSSDMSLRSFDFFAFFAAESQQPCSRTREGRGSSLAPRPVIRRVGAARRGAALPRRAAVRASGAQRPAPRKISRGFEASSLCMPARDHPGRSRGLSMHARTERPESNDLSVTRIA